MFKQMIGSSETELVMAFACREQDGQSFPAEMALPKTRNLEQVDNPCRSALKKGRREGLSPRKGREVLEPDIITDF